MSCVVVWPNVRESNSVSDLFPVCRFCFVRALSFHAMDSGFPIPDSMYCTASLSVELGFWICTAPEMIPKSTPK